ncbi:MAG: amidohydrolase, partial [Planctomycetaceae bacterium]
MFDQISRRTFLSSTVAVAAGGIALPEAVRAASAAPLFSPAKEANVTAADQIPIVDTHQHLWDLTKFRLPWAKGNAVLDRSFVTADYLEASEGQNVVKTVYMEVDVDPSQQVAEAEYVMELCRQKGNPMVGAVISGRPANAEFRDYILKYKGNEHIKGVRQVLHGDETPAGYCLDQQFVKSVQLLGELGMCFDLCMRDGELMDGDKLVAQCPGTRFVVDHCGNFSVQETDAKKRKVWEDGMKALAQRPNVVCKISGIIATAKPDWKPADLRPNLQFAMETFGPNRRMFAGDWPVCTLTASFAQWVGALKEVVQSMGMSAGDQKKLFHDNAVKFYELKDK